MYPDTWNHIAIDGKEFPDAESCKNYEGLLGEIAALRPCVQTIFPLQPIGDPTICVFIRDEAEKKLAEDLYASYYPIGKTLSVKVYPAWVLINLDNNIFCTADEYKEDVEAFFDLLKSVEAAANGKEE